MLNISTSAADGRSNIGTDIMREKLVELLLLYRLEGPAVGWGEIDTAD